MKNVATTSKILILVSTVLCAVFCQAQVRGKSYSREEWEKYKLLPERCQYIVDSLKEKGVILLDYNYLAYEPVYMNFVKKNEWFFCIESNNVIIYQYLIWNNRKGNGVRLIKEIALK